MYIWVDGEQGAGIECFSGVSVCFFAMGWWVVGCELGLMGDE